MEKLEPSIEMFRSEFAGKVAVVTGGTSGIGREIVHTLSRLGAVVHFCGRSHEKGLALQAECPSHYAQVDVCNVKELETWIDSIEVVDYLINNVADDRRVPIDEITAEDFDRAVAVNLRSHFTASLAALQALRRGTGKSIVNFGSCNYMRPEANCLLYNVAKSGITGLTRALARQLGPEMIRVNTFTPGWVATEKQLKYYMHEEEQENLKQEQALPVIMSPRDVMGALLWLLSSAAGMVTGQNILSEAGKVMQ